LPIDEIYENFVMEKKIKNFISIGKNIQRIRIAKEMKQYSLAKDAGISPTHLSKLENEKHIPTGIILKKIADALGVEVNELYDIDINKKNKYFKGEIEQNIIKENVPNYYRPTIPLDIIKRPEWIEKLIPKMNRYIPVLNQIPADNSVDIDILTFPLDFADEYIMSDVRDPDAYSLVIVGNSMLPTLNESEYVTVSPQCECNNGCIVVFRTMDGKSGIKRYKQIGTKVILWSDNKKYKELEYKIKDFVFIHKVVEVIKKL